MNAFSLWNFKVEFSNWLSKNNEFTSNKWYQSIGFLLGIVLGIFIWSKMAQVEGASLNRAPLFDGNDYVFLESYDGDVYTFFRC